MKDILTTAIARLREKLQVEAVTVFLRDEQSEELIFWAMQGGQSASLNGKKMPLKKGIVGWVIEQQRPVAVNDTAQDHRFFSTVDQETSFKTRNLMCVPLTVRGSDTLGAIEALNAASTTGFNDEDLEFLEQCAHHVALAIHNSLLFEKLKEDNAKLEKLNRRKSELITVLAHEIRTPLTIIQGGAEILALSASTEHQEIAESMLRGVARLTQFAAEIRTVGNVTGRKLTLSLAPFSTSTLLETVRAHFAAIIAQRNLRFEAKAAANDLKMVGDHALILVVLKNLIANAIRFTPDEGEIKVSAMRNNGLVEIAVTDTGIGIADDELPLIFEKFYEVGSSLNHRSGDFSFGSAGLGLGLSAAKSILEAHGASLHVESKLGAGSTFRFFLPDA